MVAPWIEQGVSLKNYHVLFLYTSWKYEKNLFILYSTHYYIGVSGTNYGFHFFEFLFFAKNKKQIGVFCKQKTKQNFSTFIPTNNE